jgi:predicted Zn-dependent peptidase
MQNNLIEEQAVKIASVNGIDVYQIETGKFKTSTINIFFHDNLRKESAARNAMIPAVLRRGTVKYPTLGDISLYLEELYGASFDCGVTKKGERQVIQFYTEFVSDKYLNENANQFEKAIDLLFEVVTNPVLEKGAFRSDYIEQEKENLKKLIESRVNDKAQYAVERCFEEMCKDEPFGIYDYGSVEDLAEINVNSLFEHYKSMLETYPMQVFITGNVQEEKIEKLLNKLSGLKRGNIKNVDITDVKKEVKEVSNVTEKLNVNQGKLSLGFRTNTSSNDREYYALMVYNGILGGGIHSKLFQNVREKASLAYYVFSRTEKFKGLMLISSGIELDNRDKAVDIILAQMEEIKKGNISDYEYTATLKSIETGLNSLKDSQMHMVDFYLSQIIVDNDDNFETLKEKIKKVTKQDIMDVSKRINLDTIYFLTSDGKGE